MRRLTWLMALTLVMAGCGSSAADEPPTDTSAGSTEPSVAPASTADCASTTARVNETMSVQVADVQRDYDVFVPEGLVGPLPVVLSYHGFTQSPSRQRATGLEALAEERGFIAVFPYGTDPVDGPTYFNIETIEAPGLADDVAFTESVLDALAAQFCVDRDRIYAMGFSNGAMFVSALACRLSDRLAAVAPVSGIVMLDGCDGRPVPIIVTHGTADRAVPYDTDDPAFVRDVAASMGANDVQEDMFGAIDRSVTSYVALWAAHNGCAPDPNPAEVDTRLTVVTYGDCTDGADVVFQIVEGGGHEWPKQILDNPLDATAAALDFFEAHPLLTADAHP